MAQTSNITLAKGGVSVTFQTTEVTDNYDNKLRIITPGQTKQKQDTGPKDPKVIDLLRITHQMVVRGSLQTEANRDKLISLSKGANVTGSPIVVTYNTHPDSPLNMFIEKLMIKEAARDKESVNERRYDIQITLTEGISA